MKFERLNVPAWPLPDFVAFNERVHGVVDPWWARVWVGTRRGSTHHTSQHRATLGVPRVEHALFMHLERSLSVLAHVLRQTASERFHRWYDLRWKVVQIDHPGPSPARSCCFHERAFS